MSIYRGSGGAGDATNDATITAVQAAATSAATSATNAANSATAAATSASGASTSATNASNSATSSAGSATSSANSATTSAGYATNSSLSADDSAASAVEAAGYASDAFDSQVASSLSAESASDSADSAISASASAYAHELAAAASASDAANSYADTLAIFGDATDVADAVAAAQLAESNASDSADAAAASAVTAAGSASSAAAQAVNAAASAATADAEATSAGASAVDAAEYAADASDYADEAQGYAGDALDAYQSTLEVYNDLETVEAAVANSLANRDAAAASATSASASASTATTQAGLATTQATNAAASAAAASAVALGNEPVRHSVRPSLLLDFANTKTLDPRITFTRASTGTFYDGETTVKAEENLLTYSEQFDNAAWGKNNLTVTANNTTAPDGTTTAELVTLTAGTSAKNIAQAVASSNPFTFSVYAKAGTYSFIQLLVQTGGAGHINFDLTNGTLSATTATGTITSVGSGWYRCTMSLTGTAATIAYISPVTSLSAVRNESWTAAGTETVFLWGAQLEQRSSVTAYTATTTAPITNYIPALQTAASGVARFEHNPVTGESLGLEIEEQRTNLLVRSEEFDNAAWSKLNTTASANTIIAPDGTLTGDKLVANSGSSIKYLERSLTIAASTTHTFSVYMKAGEYNTATIYAIAPSSPFENFYAEVNLTTGAVSNINSGGGGTVVTATATSVGNGWWRVALTGGVGTKTTLNARIYPNTSASFTGNDFSGIYIWGAQLEAGSFATSYIPTVASQVTRSADSASMTGTNFSSWYRADEGTVYSEATSPSTLVQAEISDGTDRNVIGIRNRASGVSGQTFATVSTNGTLQVGSIAGTFVSSNKVGFAYKTDDFAGSINGGTTLTDTSGIIPTVNRLNIGATAAIVFTGTIKKLAYYGRRLSNAELQGLTTI